MDFKSLLFLIFLIQLSYQDRDYTIYLGYEYGNTQGQVNVWYNGHLRPICDDHFDASDATVICRQLGYTGYSSFSQGHSCERGENDFNMDDLHCNGSERRLRDCNHSLGENCGNNECIYLTCNNSPNLRIGTNNILEFYYNSWASVCDDVFDNNRNAAEVACRQLGYPGLVSYRSGQQCNYGSSFWLDNVQCDGGENSIPECGANDFGNENCNPGECIQLNCTPVRDTIQDFILDSESSILYMGGGYYFTSYRSTGQVTGVANNLLHLSETSYYIQMASVTFENTEYHISSWFKITDILNGASNNYSLFYYSNFHLYLTSQGSLCLSLAGNSTCSPGYGFFFAGLWNNIILVQSNSDVRVYINKQLVTFDNGQTYVNGTIPKQSLSMYINYNRNWAGYVEGYNIYPAYWHQSNVNTYFNQFNIPECAYLFTECNYQGETQAICGEESNLTLDFMRSLQIPSGKEVTLYTETGYSGEYQVFSENIECQDLVYVAA